MDGLVEFSAQVGGGRLALNPLVLEPRVVLGAVLTPALFSRVPEFALLASKRKEPGDVLLDFLELVSLAMSSLGLGPSGHHHT